MGNDIKYFNFPIQLLENFLNKHLDVLTDILDYAVYTHSLKLEYGTALKRIEVSANYFNVQLGSAKRVLDNGKLLSDSISENSPKVGLNLLEIPTKQTPLLRPKLTPLLRSKLTPVFRSKLTPANLV